MSPTHIPNGLIVWLGAGIFFAAPSIAFLVNAWRRNDRPLMMSHRKLPLTQTGRYWQIAGVLIAWGVYVAELFGSYGPQLVVVAVKALYIALAHNDLLLFLAMTVPAAIELLMVLPAVLCLRHVRRYPADYSSAMIVGIPNHADVPPATYTNQV